jgi:diguanylate cyclase (GGDEF)-like protein
MFEKLKEKIRQFSRQDDSGHEVTLETVTALLDEVRNALDLEMVYVMENAGSRNTFLYSFASHGSACHVIDRNVVSLDDDNLRLLVQAYTENPVQVFGSEMVGHNHGMADGNLSCGFAQNGNLCGFVSFQPKETEEQKAVHASKHDEINAEYSAMPSNRKWTKEEKDLILCLTRVLKPLMLLHQAGDLGRWQEILEHSDAGLVTYYPILKLLLISERARDLFQIHNMYYADMPESFARENTDLADRKKLCEAFEKISAGNKTASVVFHGEHNKNVRYRIQLMTSRYNPQGKPKQVLGLLEKLDNDEQMEKAAERYHSFFDAISHTNLAEYELNLETGNITVFKVPEEWADSVKDHMPFARLVEGFGKNKVRPESRRVFETIMNCEYIAHELSLKHRSFTLNIRMEVDGESRWIEHEILLGSTGSFQKPTAAMISLRDITENERKDYDFLTGLSNMSYFLTRVRGENASADHAEGRIIYFNIAGFKLFNMKYGLEAGDDRLRSMADVLKSVYPSSPIARFDSDHFAVYETKENWEERIRTVHDEMRNLSGDSASFVQAGVCKITSDVSIEVACDRAKLACDSINGNTAEIDAVYTADLQTQAEMRQYITEHLDQAVREGRITAYYQPIVDPETGKAAGFEALARWNDAVYGFLAPSSFIPALEASGLIYRLDQYMIHKVMEDLKNCQESGYEILPVSLNLSRADFEFIDPEKIIESERKHFGMERKNLRIEITESAVIDDDNLILDFLRRMHELGYEVWMDDFGSGYSSLHVLVDYPFDEIKFDMKFLRTFNERSREIYIAMVNMAKRLKIRTLAEGVEKKEQLDFLRKIGCERVQGYYYGKPMPFAEAVQWLKSHV